MEFATDIEVRYSETDRMGIVYHSNYFAWFDLGRTRLLEAIGFPYLGIEKAGYLCPVVNADIQYGVPFEYGDYATVYTRISKITPIRATYSYRIFLKGDDPETTKPRITGSTTHCVVREDDFKPLNMKKIMPDLYAVYQEILTPEV